MKALSRLLLVSAVFTLMAGPVFALSTAPSTTPALRAASDHVPARGRSLLTLLGYGLAAFGTIKVKDTAAAAKKFVTRASAAAGDYKDGVANAGGDWEAATLAAEDNYGQATTQAIADKRFGKGVRGSGQKMQKNAVVLGAQRYGPGVQNAQDAYAQGVGPYLDVLKGLTLPPPGVRGSVANQQRSAMVQTELNKKRLGM